MAPYIIIKHNFHFPSGDQFDNPIFDLGDLKPIFYVSFVTKPSSAFEDRPVLVILTVHFHYFLISIFRPNLPGIS